MSSQPEAAMRPGHHAHLGATFAGAGTNVAVWAPAATQVWLCVFDDEGAESRLPLPECTLGIWHGYVDGLAPGARYGFRAAGPWEPAAGYLFNADKLLLDPYARAVDGALTPHPSLAAMDAARRPVAGDTSPYVPRSVVVSDQPFDWAGDRLLQTPWSRTVIYEAHLRGLTKRCPLVPEPLRGTYAGLAHEAMLHYLTDLGATAVELLPVQQFVTEPEVAARGLVNYWGYNTIGFFAPHAGYSASGSGGEQVTEFKAMVKAMHAAGIEVLLDVVYNHTAEGGIDGPTLCFRGLDDGGYYLRTGSGGYADLTGCGNTVAAGERPALRLIMDSLRYWVEEMHVDGFRFDLAPALIRTRAGVDMRAPFLAAIDQDPVLRDVKLIAEPWDATSAGYLVGGFPPPWCEWNGRFRDTVRDFWRGRAGGVRDLGYRLTGSSDLYGDDGRLPFASVNFVSCHDGFTLRDLVSYDDKHNLANGEANRDGTDDNRSWNCGVEGETDEPGVLALRARQVANLMSTLLLSTGVPMLLAGDERGRTQGGNNNAYCQDNEVSWLDWSDAGTDKRLLDLTRTLLRLRAAHPVLRRLHFFEGRPVDGGNRNDITWLQPSGAEMTAQAWVDPAVTTLGLLLAGDELEGVNTYGNRLRDSSYLIWLHAGDNPVDVAPPAGLADHYRLLLRTDDEPMYTGAARHRETIDGPAQANALTPGTALTVSGRTVILLEALRLSRH